jgi:hypothetical protein
MRRLIPYFIFGLFMLVMFAAPSYGIEIVKPDYLPGPSEEVVGSDAQEYVLNVTIPRAINIAIAILGLSAFAGILISAFNMLTAYGNEDKINRSKTTLRYSILGFIFVVLSYAIISIIVSVALPQEDFEPTSWIPNAHAVDVNDDVTILFPNQSDLIENQDIGNQEVSLPSGDLVTQILPGVVTNFLYMIGFLIFVAFMYGGVLMVIGRGNEEYVGKAKNIIVYAAISLGLVSMGYAIIFGIATLDLSNDVSTTNDDIYTETNLNDNEQ